MQDLLFYLIIGIIVTLPTSLIIFLIFKKLKPKWANYERRFVAIILGMALTPLILRVGVFGFFYLEDYYPKREFSLASWIDNPDERFEIVDDLVKNKTLIGLSTEEVENLLGEPYYMNDSTLSYYTGTRSAGFSLTFCSLQIMLDNDQVIKAEKVEHFD